MGNGVSDFDNWQVFEVDVSEAGLRGAGWADATRLVAEDNGIPVEMRFDRENGRYLVAVPTTKHYDDLMSLVDAEFMQHFEERMAYLRLQTH